MIEDLVRRLAASAPPGTFFSWDFNIFALLALTLVALICGATGPLVVGARMAFFSDALAHAAFAGVSIGFVVATGLLAATDQTFWAYVTPIMIAFGMAVGFGIAWVREKTGLASDTVIGVFFAASAGLAAALAQMMKSRKLFALEDFLFGSPLLAGGNEVFYLLLLTLVVAAALAAMYNPLLLGGFNPSLARARRLPHRLASYAFIVLLAVVVNLTVRVIGVLLINALLVVPAASAINVGRNLREVFWLSVVLCLVSAIGGLILTWELYTRLGLELGIPGTIVLVSVALFTVSAFVGPWRKRRAEQRPLPAT